MRKLVGYLRFDTEAELGVLNSIWELDRGYTNLILTQQELLSRTRVGAKVIKRHDAAVTPFERAVRSGVLTPTQRGGLTRARNTLHPGESCSARSHGSVIVSSTLRFPRCWRHTASSTGHSTPQVVRRS